jgi:hypothetical protein
MPNNRPPWMYRGHEDYDPNDIGAITEAKVAAALLDAGALLLYPWRVGRYDLAIDEGERVARVQCKTGQLHCGAVVFRPHSLRAAKRETGWRRIKRDYRGQIEYFGVYCPDNRTVYLVPIEDVPCTGGCYLRVDPPKNNQRKKIRWAKDYEVIPLRRRIETEVQEF